MLNHSDEAYKASRVHINAIKRTVGKACVIRLLCVDPNLIWGTSYGEYNRNRVTPSVNLNFPVESEGVMWKHGPRSTGCGDKAKDKTGMTFRLPLDPGRNHRPTADVNWSSGFLSRVLGVEAARS